MQPRRLVLCLLALALATQRVACAPRALLNDTAVASTPAAPTPAAVPAPAVVNATEAKKEAFVAAHGEKTETPEQAVVQEAVLEQELFDENKAAEERSRATTSALFVGALVGGSAVYCIMKGTSAGKGGSHAHAHGSAAPEGGVEQDDLKQRLNRLKALQQARCAPRARGVPCRSRQRFAHRFLRLTRLPVCPLAVAEIEATSRDRGRVMRRRGVTGGGCCGRG